MLKIFLKSNWQAIGILGHTCFVVGRTKLLVRPHVLPLKTDHLGLFLLQVDLDQYGPLITSLVLMAKDTDGPRNNYDPGIHILTCELQLYLPSLASHLFSFVLSR